MLKKVLVLAAAALFSMNASAGYIQYNLSSTGFFGSPSRMVIRDEDKSIAFFSLWTNEGIFYPYEPGSYQRDTLLDATTTFHGLGPTNMRLLSVSPEEWTKWINLKFDYGDGPENYIFRLDIHTEEGPETPYPIPAYPRDTTYFGTATQVALDPYVVGTLESGQFQLPRIVPTFVPEPASMALFAIGALGAAGVARRRRKTTA
jgi:hypothetical protein